ncbi:MAG TPA: MTH865 family protein [Oscillospiraceae bacterium]|nr:MTH865 family protein [Oscillospiraceae bacterium]
MSVRCELERQICDAIKDAPFPLMSPDALVSAFPLGIEHICRCGEAEVKVSEVKEKMKDEDFPLTTAEAAAQAMLAYYPYI